ncbi:MAG: hypothetical protein EAZ27_04595 [Cytophagales bacterium]|nr:MAG: hypothetical protein EAZ27_04595 [Cytophagales bacterium]
MQNKSKKIFILFSFLVSSTVLAGKYPQQIIEADKLFSTKKYQESYQLYYQAFQKGIITPQAVLKMALIKEGVGESVKALYFLNYFYENYPDKKIFNKMKELADKEQYKGYVYSDLEFFANVYRNYQIEIILGILGFVFLYFFAVITNKIFIKGISNTSPFLFVLFLLAIFYVVNFGENFFNPEKAVILNDKCLLMEAPAAGSNQVGLGMKGNRVQISKKIDIWAEIEYDNKTCYIRLDNLYGI